MADPDAPRASRLRTLREEAGLSRAQLALAAGVSPETVRSAEIGVCAPSPRVTAALARVLGVTVKALAGKPLTLKELRGTTGLTQRAMAEVIGMSGGMVSKVEAGLYGVSDVGRWAAGYQVTEEEWTAAWEAGRDQKKRQITARARTARRGAKTWQKDSQPEPGP
ncbi:helix-turn-helix transcriptional regulator [Kitasatospora sp. NPDC001660]